MKTLNPVPMRLLPLLAGMLLLGSLSAAAAENASAMVKSTSERMLSTLEGQRAAIERDPSRIYGLVDRILVPHFDFEKITRGAVGKHWSSASPAQRKALTGGFQQVLIRTYAKALLSYSGEDIRFLPERPGPNSSTVVVPTEVREPGGKPIPIDYKLYKTGGAWKVYDVTIDNVSLVANYRSSFNAQIRQYGIDGLISRLNEMNQKGRG
jgi:phospholipid transport system substrate-binding protein